MAAILAADVVRVLRLMGKDEEGTFAALKGIRDTAIKEHRGRIVKTHPEGLLGFMPGISYLPRKCACMTALRSANGTLSCCSGLCRIRAHHQRWRHEANTMSGDDSNFRRLHGVDDARGRLC